MAVSIGNPEGLAQIRALVEREFTWLVKHLGVGDWLDLTLHCSESDHPTDAWCAADTEAKWEYRQAKIKVYLPAVAGHTRKDVRGILLHEIVHAIVAPMESLIKENDAHTRQCELAVETLTRAFLDFAGLER